MIEDIRRLKQLSMDDDSVNEDVASSAKCVSQYCDDYALAEILAHVIYFHLIQMRNRQDSTEIYKIYKGFTKLDIGELFAEDLNVKGTRAHSLKLEKLGYVRDIRRYFFSHRVVGRWNALDQYTVVSVLSRED